MSPAAAETVGRRVGGGEPGVGEQAGCGRRKEAEDPGTAAQSRCVLPLPLTWVGEGNSSAQKGQLDVGLRVKQVVTGEQKAFWKMAGLERAPDQSILRERSRGEPNFKVGTASLPVCIFRCSPGFGSHTLPFHLL